MKTEVMAGIITFNPDISRLRKNIDAIVPQVHKILIVDNCSDDFSSLEKFKSDKVAIVFNKTNIGIAEALNKVMEYASYNDYKWVITLDQDSITPRNFIEDSSVHFSDSNVAQVVPRIYDENVDMYYDLGTTVNNKHFQEVTKSITSASITNVEIWEKIGKFDSYLFIDYVDYDYCMRINNYGYKILRNNTKILFHELGASKIRNFLFFKIRISNHSSFRKYYISRNMIIYIKRYFSVKVALVESMRLIRVVFCIFFEKNRIKKLLSIARGIIDGIKYNV